MGGLKFDCLAVTSKGNFVLWIKNRFKIDSNGSDKREEVKCNPAKRNEMNKRFKLEYFQISESLLEKLGHECLDREKKVKWQTWW